MMFPFFSVISSTSCQYYPLTEMTITALFKTSFRSDFPFDVVELFVFSLVGVMCGFAGAGYVAFHRQIVQFNRNQKWLNKFLQKK